MTRRAAVPLEQEGPFVPVLETKPALLDLDARIEQAQGDLDLEASAKCDAETIELSGDSSSSLDRSSVQTKPEAPPTLDRRSGAG